MESLPQRYCIQLAYNGEKYHGWQIQPKAISVQGEITRGIELITRQKGIDLVGAGRTDAGVHASFYVSHFDSEHILPQDFGEKLNRFLPSDIEIVQVFSCPESFHARFDATARTYHYFVSQGKQPFFDRISARIPIELDINAMNNAAIQLIKYTDFTSFSKLHTDVNNNNCTIEKAVWKKKNDLLIFEIKANRFLRNMVRAIVGTLIEVGKHKMSLEQFIEVIEAKDRCEAGMSVPACGLFLSNIEYPNSINDMLIRKPLIIE